MKHSLLLALASMFSISSAFAGNDPASVMIKMYSVWAAAGADCSSPMKVCDLPGTYVDMASSPTLCQGVKIPEGSYKCVIIEMSDTIKYNVNSTAAANLPVCKTTTTYTMDVCRADSSSKTTHPETLTETNCTGTNAANAEDRVFMYMHTAAAAGGGQTFEKPANSADSTRGIPLAQAWTVTSSSVGKFYADFRDKIVSENSGTTCGCDAPTFGFK